MATLTASELARKLSAVLDRLEFEGEEIVVVRNNHAIARIIPGAPFRTAIDALADLHHTIPPHAAKDWIEESRIPGSLKDQMPGDPWAT